MSRPRVLICGSRDWTDPHPIKRILLGYGRGTTLIHGAARGADQVAGGLGETFGFEVIEFPADWRGHGRAAGPIRNKLMLAEGKPTIVYAFKNGFDWTFKKGGTENMIKLAVEAEIPHYVISSGR